MEYSSNESKKTKILDCFKIYKLVGDKPAKLKKPLNLKSEMQLKFLGRIICD